MSKVSVLGAGSWGLALSLSLCKNGHDVTVWSPFEREIAELSAKRENEKLLPGVKIPDAIALTSDLSEIEGSAISVIATPSFAVRETAKRLSKTEHCGIIVNVAKGIEYETLYTLSQVIEDELPGRAVVILSGPSHAEEVARGIETSLVAASRDEMSAKCVQNAFSSDKLRVYTNTDVIGTQLGGAFKNIIAIAAGICDGLHLGDNTRAALITRGLTEIARLGIHLGANEKTFAGLTGMGDLIVTCTSVHSRNHRFGELLGQGVSIEEALERVGTVEGYYAALAAEKIRNQYGISMPIVEQSYLVMYKNKKATDAARDLMIRPSHGEIDDNWLN